MKNKKTYKFSKKARKNMSIAQQLRRSKEVTHTVRETLDTRVPIYEGKKLIGYTDELSSVENFIKAMPKRKYTKKMPAITTKKSKTGCFPLIFIAYLLFWAVYGWMNTSEIVEAKIDTVSVVKVEEVKTTTLDIKTQPEVILEELEPIDESVEGHIVRVFGEYSDKALKIAECESHFIADAIGDVTLTPSSYGVFQIRAFEGRPTPAELLDAKTNIEYAYELSEGGTNWNPWSCNNLD